MQVYKYAEKTARVVFGPDMVVLGPHEDFNVLSLSGKNLVKLIFFRELKTGLPLSELR